MMRLSTATAFSALALATAPLCAQSVALDKRGGALGGNVTFTVRGTANDLYVILFALFEQTTPVPALGVTLAIPDTFAGPSLGIPGFFGTLPGNGEATAAVPVPADPGFAGLRLPFQAVVGSAFPFAASNLVRVTLQPADTFAPTLTQPAVPIAGGGVLAMANGEQLFVGGSGPVAQRYAERTEEWTSAGASFGVGLLAQTTPLADGRVLFTGGLDLATGQPTAAAAVYDPATQQTTTLTMALPRAGHGASRLGNGRVLITGGLQSFDLTNPLASLQAITATTEVFDPTTNSFTAGPNMLEARALHTSTTLTNGDVLVAGGLALLPIVNLPNVSSTAYRFNPATNSFGFPSLFTGGRLLHSATALSNGRVLLAGGLSVDLTAFLTSGRIEDIVIGTRTDAQLYTPGSFGFGSFATVQGMQDGRAAAASAPLPNGGALIAGGFRLTVDVSTSTFDFALLDSADAFASNPSAFRAVGAMGAPRAFGLATPLPDGTVLVVGGGGPSEVFQH